MAALSEETKRQVWTILVEEVGAYEGHWDQFCSNWPECREYRFQGTLGFGGKVYIDTFVVARVVCYPEDRNPARDGAIQRTNARLARL